VAAWLGKPEPAFLDPLTILVRTLTVSIWPALDRIVSAVESVLYSDSSLLPAHRRLRRFLRPSVLPTEPIYYRECRCFFFDRFCGVIGFELLRPAFLVPLPVPVGRHARIDQQAGFYSP